MPHLFIRTQSIFPDDDEDAKSIALGFRENLIHQIGPGKTVEALPSKPPGKHDAEPVGDAKVSRTQGFSERRIPVRLDEKFRIHRRDPVKLRLTEKTPDRSENLFFAEIFDGYTEKMHIFSESFMWMKRFPPLFSPEQRV